MSKTKKRIKRLGSFWASDEFAKLPGRKRRKIDRRLKSLIKREMQDRMLQA